MHKPDDFAPGTFGCHEALHMASVLMEMVDERLCEHPAIVGNAAWTGLANKAREALFDLYQEIGVEHVREPTSDAGGEVCSSSPEPAAGCGGLGMVLGPTPMPVGSWEMEHDLMTSIGHMEISVGAMNRLTGAGLVYVGDLIQKSEMELLRIPGFGRKALHDVKEALARMSLSMGACIEGWAAYVEARMAAPELCSVPPFVIFKARPLEG